MASLIRWAWYECETVLDRYNSDCMLLLVCPLFMTIGPLCWRDQLRQSACCWLISDHGYLTSKLTWSLIAPDTWYYVDIKPCLSIRKLVKPCEVWTGQTTYERHDKHTFKSTPLQLMYIPLNAMTKLAIHVHRPVRKRLTMRGTAWDEEADS